MTQRCVFRFFFQPKMLHAVTVFHSSCWSSHDFVSPVNTVALVSCVYWEEISNGAPCLFPSGFTHFHFAKLEMEFHLVGAARSVSPPVVSLQVKRSHPMFTSRWSWTTSLPLLLTVTSEELDVSCQTQSDGSVKSSLKSTTHDTKTHAHTHTRHRAVRNSKIFLHWGIQKHSLNCTKKKRILQYKTTSAIFPSVRFKNIWREMK